MSLSKRAWLKIFAAVSTTVVLVVGGLLWWLLRVEDIPDELEQPGDPSTIDIPGVGAQPPLRVAELAGSTVFFVHIGIQNWESEEGRALNRALNRWEFPDTTTGYIIFDAQGLGFLKDGATKYMDAFGNETRFPIYGDFEGQFREVFKLPQGHHGFVVLAPDGTIDLRHSGGFSTPQELADVAKRLGAREPEPGPEPPDFAVAGLNPQVCARTPCALIFLDRPIATRDVPGVDDGFEGEDEERWKQEKIPAVRMVSAAVNLRLGEAAKGVIVGDVTGFEFDGWTVVPEASELRTAFEIEPETSTMLVIAGGTVALRQSGTIPMYRFGAVSDALGVEFEFE